MLCRVTKLEQTQADFTEMQEKLVKKVDDLENKVDDKIKEALLEQKERENRKLNIMCFGLSESEKETPEDRHGPRKPGKCRPVCLTIESIERKKKVLEAARTKVRNSDSKCTCSQRLFSFRLNQQSFSLPPLISFISLCFC